MRTGRLKINRPVSFYKIAEFNFITPMYKLIYSFTDTRVKSITFITYGFPTQSILLQTSYFKLQIQH